MADLKNGVTCPLPVSEHSHIQLAHGGGGRLMHQLIDRLFLAELANPLLDQRHDGTVFSVETGRLAFTSDSFVVQPLFFPGGDIGSLAVHGTVNDLAMCGARPLYLSVSFILEEGLPVKTLERLVSSMKDAAAEVGVRVITGDTKVVDKGKGDGVFVSTSGIGLVEHSYDISPASVRSGDAIIISGDLGRHGLAVMNAREELGLEMDLQSDSASIWGAVEKLLDAGVEVHCLRDLTRGGLASVLIEVTESCSLHTSIDETSIPVCTAVRAGCEILGLDPLYVANEGRFAVWVPEPHAEKTLEILREVPVSSGACRIGKVGTAKDSLVTIKTSMGATRIVDMLSGEQLPRIC